LARTAQRELANNITTTITGSSLQMHAQGDPKQ